MQVLAVGVSPTRFSEGPSVPFAASDARRFASIAGTRGTALCDRDATRPAITRAIEMLLDGNVGESRLLVLIAPAMVMDHRFCVELADGSADLGELLGPLWISNRERVTVALDLARGLDRPHADWPIAVEALIDELKARSGRALLLSDDGQNISHVSGELQSGVWAYHLAQAFDGRDPRSREADGRLTARSLRDYLDEEIDASLRRAFSEPRSQSPLTLASHDDYVLAEPHVEARTAALPGSSAGLELRSEESIPVKQLGGFQKSIHTAPGDFLDTSREWILRLAEPNLRRELEQTVARLRQELGYTRRQVRASGPTHGGASILTPDFAVHFAVAQSAEKPQIAILKRTLGEFRNLDVLNRDALALIFPKGFTELFQPFHSPADIESLIDTLEAARLPHVQTIDYPTDPRHCEITLAGFAGRVRFEPAGLTIASESPLPPADLARGYGVVRGILG